MKSEYRDVNWLKKNCQMIHYFGLGFIQLKINKLERMHFYTKKLPAIVSIEDVHNHRYNFQSQIVAGKLHQELYQVTTGNAYIREQESCKVDVKTETPGVLCGIKWIGRQIFDLNSFYAMDHDTFHRVYSDHCVTYLKRSNYRKEFAEVIRPVGGEKVCPFSKKVEEQVLWEIVEDMLK